MEDYSIILVVIGERTFAGKFAGTELEDCVEFQKVFDPRGQMLIVGVMLGDMIVPSTSIQIKLNNKSPYYKNYFATVTNISLVKVD